MRGSLADVLKITIMDADEVLYQGTPSALTRDNATAVNDVLRLHEQCILTIYFHFPQDASNSTQHLDLFFDLCADAVQTKNNPDKLF